MTLVEMGKLLSLIQAYYPKFADGRNLVETGKAWLQIFPDAEYADVQNAILAYVSTETKGFPPTPGALKNIMVKRPDSLSAFEAWNLVKRAASNGWYHSEEEFAKLPPLCKRIVGAPGTLKDWAVMDLSELDTVVASNFQRSYNHMVEKSEFYEKLPQKVLEALPGFDRLGLMPSMEGAE